MKVRRWATRRSGHRAPAASLALAGLGAWISQACSNGPLAALDGAIFEDASRDEGVSVDRPDPAEGDTRTAKRQLFNGRDWSGWETYLGPPNGEVEPIGANRDPDGVFSIVRIEGGPAIHISGEVWGALSTVEEFGNYHLHAEFEWGSHPVWPPLTVRDGGLMYHSVGPFGAVKAGGGALADPPLSGYFMTSLELQIAQDDVGSCYSLGPISFDGGAFSRGAVAQFENPVGAWNVLDVFALGSESVHYVNGHAVVHLKDAVRFGDDGGTVPLTRGKIQLQSESMEIFFRNITIEPIDSLQSDVP